MPEKIILLTGSSRGLGQATAQVLAQHGHALILSSRSAAQGEAACCAVRAVAPSAQVEAVTIDLASTASIRQAGQQLSARRIDVLFHCAGIMQQSPVRRTTADGFEETLGVNVLAPMLLTRLLLPCLGRSPGARVICVTSRMHRPGGRGAAVHFEPDNPELLQGYDPNRAYKNSKLALLWFTYELARRLRASAIGVHAVCPGFVPTTAAESVHGAMRFFLRYVLRFMPFATSKEVAARNLAALVLNPALAGQTGTYWEDGAHVLSSPESLDAEKAAWFFAWASQRLGIADWPAAGTPA